MTLVRARSVKEVADFVQARVLGDETVQLTGISSVQSAGPGDLVFVDDEKNLRAALESQASAVIAGDFAAGKTNSKPLLLSAATTSGFCPGCTTSLSEAGAEAWASIPAQSCIRRRNWLTV